MPRKKTQEEYENEVAAKIPHIKVVGRYVNNRVDIEHHCLKHGVSWMVSLFNLLQHLHGCPHCQREALDTAILKRRKTDEQFRKISGNPR